MFLSERLPLAASLFPDAPALKRNGQTITYSELYQLAQKVGRVLSNQGIKAGDRLAI